jgi:hypothetical protein
MLPFSAGDRSARVGWLRDSLAGAVSAFEQRWVSGGALVCPPNDGSVAATVHDFGDYALAKLALSGAADPAASALAEASLGCLFSYQKFGSPSETDHGVFPFHLGDPPRPQDNPTEFALLPVGRLVTDFPLSASLANMLEPRIRAGLAAIEQHVVCPSYTNICWMQTAEMLALGRWLAARLDPAVAAEGRAFVASAQGRLDGWLAFTRGAGLTEFDSPTYSEVDLETMLVAFRAADHDARTKVRAALDYLWSDLAANSSARGILAGPLSRTYDFLTAQGGLTVSLYLERLRLSLPTQGADLTKAVLLLNEADAAGYRAPASALCLSALPEREVLSTYGADAGTSRRERYVYITPDFTLGSASADYGTSVGSDQDELLRAELGASSRIPVIAVIADYLDAPGTSVREGDFTKVTHLLMSPAAAQRREAMLALLRVEAKDPQYAGADGGTLPLRNLATNVTFPASADAIWLDGAPADLSRDQVVSARPTLAVQIGSGAVAMSVLEAGGLECPNADGSIGARSVPEVHVKPLAPSSSARDAVARLVVYHDLALPADTSTLAKCFARASLLFLAQPCRSAGCLGDLTARARAASDAAVRRWDPATGDWDVTVTIDGGPMLRVHRGLGQNPQVLAREIDGTPLTFPPLSVNGIPISLGP